ncbi:AbiH family protein [Roseivirga misakiensis]|uniref:Bacteriophage abortive infection AbiH n=1 Tax=Roseivirga misakiensis TaxID=1563681 RepID=A0A1E5T5F6_9BACT|nr:AbiH family protein [Roseivirga misakiensis]OEK06578.1 hypothetical protein BFP71_02585 [Roseivirga misakiensis]
MNRVFLIGNGFDLAHGMPTSFDDFVKDLIRSRIDHGVDSESQLVQISLPDQVDEGVKITSKEIDFTKPINDITNEIRVKSLFKISNLHLPEFLELKLRNSIKFEYPNKFFATVLSNTSVNNWVEFEHNYYKHFLKIFKGHYKKEEFRIKAIHSLNEQFNQVKVEFSNYIAKVNQSAPKQKSVSLQSLFLSKKIKGKVTSIDDMTYEHHEVSEVLILNFNYTDTVRRYSLPEFDTAGKMITQAQVIDIHGEAGNPNNPIIFGYGDEMQEHYSQIEALNDDKALEHFKSIHYSRTENYHQLESFLKKGSYWVDIIGHSCGLSDRVLLKEIFEPNNCKGITIRHHDGKGNGSGELHHREIFTHIARCFSPENKSKVRSKVIPFRVENRCPQLTGSVS